MTQLASPPSLLAPARTVPSIRTAATRSLVGTRWERLALVGLVLVAGAIRLPYLWDIPLFTDETDDSLLSFAIYEGRKLPLVNVSSYIGALYNYLEAGAFWLLGPSVYTPRLLIFLLGPLAVVTTYYLARAMIGRPAAWLAAGLLATSGVHIGGNSHVAWSQMISPLVMATFLLLLYRAVERRSGPTLLGAALACALTLQTHATNLAFMPGAALYALWKWPGVLRTRWVSLAVVVFLAGYWNLIAYNLLNDFDSLDFAQTVDEKYSPDEEVRDLPSYLAIVGRLALVLARMAAGAVDARPAPADYLLDPQVLLFAGLTLAGLAWLARRGNPLPLLVILSGLLIFPFFGARHEILPRQGRYLAPLLPVLFTALAVASWKGWLRWGPTPPSPLPTREGGVTAPGLAGKEPIAERPLSGSTDPLVRVPPSLLEKGVRWLGPALALLLVLLPLLPLQRYYAAGVAAGQTNARFFQLLAEVEASRPNGEFVVLDYQLAQESLGGGGTPLRVMKFMLTVRGIPFTDLTMDPDRVVRRYGDRPTILVLTEKTYANVGPRLPLAPAAGKTSLTPPAPYGIYRLAPGGG